MLIVRHLGTPNSDFNGCHCVRDPVLYRSMVVILICQHHSQSRENESCHVLCSSCPYFEVGVARTVPNSHVMVFCSVPLVFSKSGVFRTVNGAAPFTSNLVQQC